MYTFIYIYVYIFIYATQKKKENKKIKKGKKGKKDKSPHIRGRDADVGAEVVGPDVLAADVARERLAHVEGVRVVVVVADNAAVDGVALVPEGAG